MAGVITWFCACPRGRGLARERALKPQGYARRDGGPRAVSAGTAVGQGRDGGVMAWRGVMGQAKRSELKRAARQLGITSTTLRQRGWKTASSARVRAARENPPDWLAAARKRRHTQRFRQRGRRDRECMAAGLGALEG
ncbi:MAG TPA: hypothetical protein VGI96_18555 [Streptosporangiaceae bacterium]|jgi:hypothetical protein